ncbi:mitochondrial glycine transporter isoform X2 [Nilaparvata lugens]|uniref:mitochondrial glycine transporter isoform X2 n=1 Tax=Nilaparvata lugens TaxID=108931 RepID=UPI00193E9796|nr:mitochondrial glycine transporter isoform X2 [Nilaparvata lugens]
MAYESPLVKAFLAGSFSGTVSTILFQPLDLVKTRLQTSPSTVYNGPRPVNNGVFHVVSSIIQKEQVTGLWRGMIPSISRCVPGVGLYFASLHYLKGVFVGNDGKNKPSSIQAILIGMTARSISGVCLIPMTVIKTRYESGHYKYTSIPSAALQIYRQEGARGLTCGLLPTLARDAPFSGIYFMFYSQLQALVPADMTQCQSLANFGCGVAAGILASTVTQPADVIKTKMQLYPNKFASLPGVLVYVHKKYGIKGYFKGLGPRMLRKTLIAAMAWTLYEKATVSMGLK